MQNYIKLKHFSLLFAFYAYIDAKEHLADNLFINEKVTVHFKQEFIKPGCKYAIVFCKIRKKDKGKFLDALAQLEKKMLIMGYSDYPDFCNDLLQRWMSELLP